MKFYTTGEAARICGVGLNTIKDWIRRGKLRAIRTPGGHWRIPENEFHALLASMGIPLAPTATSGKARPGNVLIIDDEPAAHELMQGLLELALPGWEAHSAFDGYTGLIQIGQLQPDLILLDVMMPNINGLEVIHRLRGPDSPMPGARIIAITAASDRRLVVRRLREAGPDAILYKPLDQASFTATIRQVLGPAAYLDFGEGI